MFVQPNYTSLGSDMVIQLCGSFMCVPTACFLFALNTLFWLIYNLDIKLELGVINLIETCLKMPEAWDKHGSQRNPEQEQEGGAWQYDTRRNMIKNPYIAGKPSAFSSEVVPKEKSLYIKCSVVNSFQHASYIKYTSPLLDTNGRSPDASKS
jgi:hypothetical protein